MSQMTPAAEPWQQRGRRLLIVAVVLTGVIGLAGGAYIAWRAGDPEGAGLSIGYAVVPLPLLALMLWWLDRYEPEPHRYLWGAFVWGGVVAVAFSLALEIWIGNELDLSDEQLASFVAGPVEETGKGLFFAVTFLRARRVIDGFIDALVYATTVGLGFAFVENIGYYASSYLGTADKALSGADGAALTFVVRGVSSPLAHPLFTCVLGIAVAVAVQQRSRWIGALTVVGGWCGSVLLHCAWNGSVSYLGGGGFILVYGSLAMMLAGLTAMAAMARVRQLRTAERSLSHVADRGWIHPAEIPWLTHFGHRRAAREHASRTGGRAAAKDVARYQRLGAELAFLHDAVMTGRHRPGGVERTRDLVFRMDQLRPQLHLPPAIAPVRGSRA